MDVEFRVGCEPHEAPTLGLAAGLAGLRAVARARTRA